MGCCMPRPVLVGGGSGHYPAMAYPHQAPVTYSAQPAIVAAPPPAVVVGGGYPGYGYGHGYYGGPGFVEGAIVGGALGWGMHRHGSWGSFGSFGSCGSFGSFD